MFGDLGCKLKATRFFNTIYIMVETPEEWKNNFVIPILRMVANRRWKITAYLMIFIKYKSIFNEKLKAQAKQFLSVFSRMGNEKAAVALMHHLL
jgi:hypothetical protein